MGKLADAFAKNVRATLAKRGWSQAELARRMGKSPQTLQAYLPSAGASRVSEPGLSVVEEFASALGVPPGTLLEGTLADLPPVEHSIEDCLAAVTAAVRARAAPASDPSREALIEAIRVMSPAEVLRLERLVAASGAGKESKDGRGTG